MIPAVPPFIHLGSLQIPLFFLVISLSLSGLLFYLSYRVNTFSKNRKIAFELALLVMISSFIGARLMHVFYEEWAYYRLNPLYILYFWNGGFVYYGGLLFSLITGYLYIQYQKINFSEWADFFTPLFSSGHALGRLGCFLSGCCYGAHCTLPWAISEKHPTALYLIAGELILFLMLLFFEKKQICKLQGSLFLIWLLLHGLLRFIVEFFRDDPRGPLFSMPFLGFLSVSQLISLAIIIGCLFVCFFVLFYYKNNSLKK